ncbi:MAG: glycoside hydrolase family 92 protein [Candidatus Eisenbacteria bacterium]|nr:glycoside hydrolase family 92 protein [Candidatus Eisenbacteria bacterium]
MRTALAGLAFTMLFATNAAADAGPAPWASPSANLVTRPTLTSWVDPFIGTGGHGHTFPGATRPFSMVQLSPDTRLEGWDGCSGYHYSDSLVYGFSHTHLSGTGVADYCDILMMPTTGDLRLGNGADGRPGYRSRFTHAREHARPGLYAVDLLDSGVHVDLTTTERAGLHRYVFPAGRPAHVILDLTHRDPVIASSIRFVGDREIEGLRRSKSWARDQILYFVIHFDRPWTAQGIARGDTATPALREAEGKSLKAWVDFGTNGGTVLAKVGLSAVDVAGARKNLDTEIPEWDFDAVRWAADEAWERELAKITVDGGAPSDRRTFYTALYHCLIAPNVYSDVDGRYRGRDLQIHHADFRVSTVFSLWDTFRALHPLLAITHRTQTTDFIRTFLAQYQDGGRLPVWELSGNETDCMIGYHAVSVIADAIAKGIGGFDTKLALAAMVHSADEDRHGLASYKRLGFVAGEEEGESVSKTLEYAYDDWCIAATALRLGDPAIASRFDGRARGWRNLFDPSTDGMRARLWGLWFSPFDPRQVNGHYTEGNAWQWSWFVPHDVDGLMRLHGGPTAFASHLDAFFAADSRLTGNTQDDVTGMIGQYAHGNEPSHHIAYLYAFAGQPWKTQALVHHILDSLYTDAPDGLCGNEDCGQMSAWYVMSALGLYAVTPGTDTYVLGTPRFDRATIRLEKGRTFVIRAARMQPGAFYVRRARLGGRDLPRSFIRYADIANGGELDFDLAATPDTTWATAPADRPRTGMPASAMSPTPFVASGAGVFRDSTVVALGCAEPGAVIGYALDPSAADLAAGAPEYRVYDRPLVMKRTTRLVATVRGAVDGLPLDVTFHRLTPGRTITLSARYNPQYSAGGDDALIDGLEGGANFRDGRWQGYQGTDLDATVDLGANHVVHGASMRFLQDAWPWIFMPREVRYFVSTDGVHWTDEGAVDNTVGDDVTDVTIRVFAIAFPATPARYVRAHVVGHGALPAWHPGHGSPSFFFTDELEVK